MLLASQCGDCELLNFGNSPVSSTVKYLVYVRGQHKLAGRERVPVRIHSECFTGDVLGSQRCDCGEQLQRFLQEMSRNECAVLIYIKGHEGRGGRRSRAP